MPEDFLGLFRNETDTVTLQPGQVLFEKGDAGGHHMYVRCRSPLAITISKACRRAESWAKWR